jgi:hypothetical protein
MISTYSPTPDIDVLTTAFPIPGFGFVPINAFVLHGVEPVLVDTGPVVEADDFMVALRSVIDPASLKWIWLSHTDFDHIGTLHRLLAEHPQLRVITTFLGVGIMSLSAPLPMDRVYLLNPGQKITVGDRSLTAFRPPLFDNPSTTGFFEDKSRVLFSSDCFGALLQNVPDSAADLSDEDLRTGQCLWATIDSPWLHDVDFETLAGRLDTIGQMDATMVLSSHLPAAPGPMKERLLASLAAAPTTERFVGPDQIALEQMLAQMTGPPQ